MQPEQWISLEEIAQHLAVSQDTVHRWISKRGLPAHQVGKISRFKISQVNACVQQHLKIEDVEE